MMYMQNMNAILLVENRKGRESKEGEGESVEQNYITWKIQMVAQKEITWKIQMMTQKEITLKIQMMAQKEIQIQCKI